MKKRSFFNWYREVEHKRSLAKERARERKARREKRLEEIKKRPRLGFSYEKGIYFGTPVLGDEWQSLCHGAKVIVFREFSKEKGWEGPMEAFIVGKTKGGKLRKMRLTHFHENIVLPRAA